MGSPDYQAAPGRVRSPSHTSTLAQFPHGCGVGCPRWAQVQAGWRDGDLADSRTRQIHKFIPFIQRNQPNPGAPHCAKNHPDPTPMGMGMWEDTEAPQAPAVPAPTLARTSRVLQQQAASRDWLWEAGQASGFAGH